MKEDFHISLLLQKKGMIQIGKGYYRQRKVQGLRTLRVRLSEEAACDSQG